MAKIDIISGFLGAGKTTLIKKLLTEAYGDEKLVLIENEFGEISIDGGFLQESGVEISEMSSGCICCSLVGDFGEALKDAFKAYARQTVKNAAALAEALKAEGFRLVSGGTDNHLMLLDLRPFGITGKEFERRLDEVNITVNKNTSPNDPEKPFVTSGIRVGTPAVTSRGFKEPEMVQIARWLGMAARDFDGNANQIRTEVRALCEKFPLYE